MPAQYQPVDPNTSGILYNFCTLPLTRALDWLANDAGLGYVGGIFAVALVRYGVGHAGARLTGSDLSQQLENIRRLTELSNKPVAPAASAGSATPDGGVPSAVAPSEPSQPATADTDMTVEPAGTEEARVQVGARAWRVISGCLTNLLTNTLGIAFFLALWRSFLMNPNLSSEVAFGFPLLGEPDLRLFAVAMAVVALQLGLGSHIKAKKNPNSDRDSGKLYFFVLVLLLVPGALFRGFLMPAALTLYVIFRDVYYIGRGVTELLALSRTQPAVS